MIIVCEPQCKGFSHEKVNSGFLYGLRLAFPEEKILVYADPSHILALNAILLHDEIPVDNIEFVSIEFLLNDSFKAFFVYRKLFEKLLTNVISEGEDRLFMLSFSPKILYVLKKLKQKQQFSKLKFTSILHGDFENVANDAPPSLLQSLPGSSTLDKIKQKTISEIFKRVLELAFNKLAGLKNFPVKWFNAFFETKKMLQLFPSSDFRYIALSPHALMNAAKYLDLEIFRMYAVVLPTVFAKPLPKPENSFVKFAVFGYGNALMLKQVAQRLSQKGINKPYEIRIIGMDNSGLESFPNITCPSPGKQLTRSEMEKFAVDIDMFLILYDQTRYRLTCSGSILESLSYMKPVLHFENDCINYFNREENPIGICCSSIDEYADKMKDIIENYSAYSAKFDLFRENISQLRDKVSIKNWAGTIHDSFTW